MQFIPQLRSKYPLFHRINGWLYVLCVILSLIGSCTLLSKTGKNAPFDTFSGVVFKIELSAYWLGVFVSFILGIYYILAQRIIIHRQFMIISYSLGCGAPFLRWCWAAYYWIYKNNTMEENNITSTIPLIAITTIALHFTVSYGDTENQRNLRRFWSTDGDGSDGSHIDENGLQLETVDKKNMQVENGTQTGVNKVQPQVVESKKRSTTIDVCVLVVALVTNTIFGAILSPIRMFGDLRNVWFDNKDFNDDASIVLRVIHWLSWLVLSYYVIVMLGMFSINWKWKSKQYDCNYKNKMFGIVLVGLGMLCGVVTFVYVTTFDTNEYRLFGDANTYAWIINVLVLWYVFVFFCSFVFCPF